jgi:hypothetical protein
MAHHAFGPSAARILTNGTILQYWYNFYEYDLQPAQNADVTQESPTIAGISPWEQSGSSLQFCEPISTTSQASYNLDHALNCIPDPLSTKKFRRRDTKACAVCKKRKAKCVLGDGKSCLRCDHLGIECNVPAARLVRREKELKGRSGRAPRKQCVFATMRGMNLLTYEQDDHRTRTCLEFERRVACEDRDIGGCDPRDCKAHD